MDISTGANKTINKHNIGLGNCPKIGFRASALSSSRYCTIYTFPLFAGTHYGVGSHNHVCLPSKPKGTFYVSIGLAFILCNFQDNFTFGKLIFWKLHHHLDEAKAEEKLCQLPPAGLGLVKRAD